MPNTPLIEPKPTKKADKVLAKIRKMPAPYDTMGERLHTLILDNAPGLEPTWRWGLPFYSKDGKDICYFKKGETCMTFGFGEHVTLSHDPETPRLMACAWNFTELDEATRDRLARMLHQAIPPQGGV